MSSCVILELSKVYFKLFLVHIFFLKTNYQNKKNRIIKLSLKRISRLILKTPLAKVLKCYHKTTLVIVVACQNGIKFKALWFQQKNKYIPKSLACLLVIVICSFSFP